MSCGPRETRGQEGIQNTPASTLSPNYDALVSDGQDNVLIAITGQTGGGIAVIDLTSVLEPPPVPYSTYVAKSPVQRSLSSNQRRELSNLLGIHVPKLDSHSTRIKHTTNQTVLARHETEPRK